MHENRSEIDLITKCVEQHVNIVKLEKSTNSEDKFKKGPGSAENLFLREEQKSSSALDGEDKKSDASHELKFMMSRAVTGRLQQMDKD